MSAITFHLAVSEQAPFRYQAAALTQLVREASFELMPLTAISSTYCNPATGPFLALISDEFPVPLYGLSTIIEAMHRRFPDKGYLPEDPIARSRSRATAQIIEQRLSYYLMAEIAWQKFGRGNGTGDVTIGGLILETPPPLESIDRHHAQIQSRFMAGDEPSLADCHMAALWWTAENLQLAGELEALPALAEWHAQNCAGAPFHRP